MVSHVQIVVEGPSDDRPEAVVRPAAQLPGRSARPSPHQARAARRHGPDRAKQSQFPEGRAKANCLLEKGLGEKRVAVAGAKTKPICAGRRAYGDPKRVLSRLRTRASVRVLPPIADLAEGWIVRNKAKFGGRETKVSAVGNEGYAGECGLWQCEKRSQFARPGAARHGAAVRNKANFPGRT